MTVVLITGALTGIGRATAVAFANEGDQIVVSGRHGDAGADLVEELRALGAEAEFICADVRHDGEMRSLIDQTVKRFGRLDVAVNNAGTEGHPGPVTKQTPESYAAAAKARGVRLGRHGAEVLAPKLKEGARQRAMELEPVITQLKGKGLSLAKIAGGLNKRKVTTPRGGKWDHSSVVNVLQRLAA